MYDMTNPGVGVGNGSQAQQAGEAAVSRVPGPGLVCKNCGKLLSLLDRVWRDERWVIDCPKCGAENSMKRPDPPRWRRDRLGARRPGRLAGTAALNLGVRRGAPLRLPVGPTPH